MLHVVLKSIWFRKFRLLMTSIAVVIGVAFMAGTLVLSSTISKSFDDLFSSAFAGVDAQVRGQEAFSSFEQGGALRPSIDASLINEVRSVSGVRSADGNVDGYAQIVDKQGHPITTGGAPTFGSVWVSSPDFAFKLSEGVAPSTDNQVVIDRASARRGKFNVGDPVTVLVNGPPVKATVSGIARFGTADSPGGATFALFTQTAAQKYFGEPGKFTSIDVHAASGVSQQNLKQRLASELPKSVEVITGKELTDENKQGIEQVLKFLNIFLLVFAGVALFVGVFIIYNVFSILVAQRTKENALLRALGASRGQIIRSVVAEALVVGFIAAGVGLVAGIGLALGLKALLEAFDIKLPSGGLVVPVSAVVSSLVVGVVVTTVSALLPARRASKVPPVAAMRDVNVDHSGSSRKRFAIGVLLLASGVGAILIGLFSDVDKAYIPVGAGVPVTFLGVATLGPTIAGPASVVLGWLPARLRGIPGKLAQQNARRNPRRTSSTAAALMIGVGLVGFMMIITASTKASVTSVIDKTISGDFVVQPSDQGFQSGLPPLLTQQLNTVPEVQVAIPISYGPAQVEGKISAISGVDTKRLEEVIDVGVKSGSVSEMTADGMAVSQKEIDSRHWKLGDTVHARFVETGEKVFKIEAIFDNDDLFPPYVISSTAYSQAIPRYLDIGIYVKKASSVSDDQARAAIEKVTSQYPNAKLLDQTEYKKDFASQVDQVLGLFLALLALSVVIALIGIAITLILSIYERTREVGLLRAVGMTRRQLRASIRWEAMIVALLGTLLGLIVAIFFGVSLVSALKDEGVNVLRVPVGELVVVAVVGALAGVFAAVIPAWWAARLNVLRAISTE